MINVLSEINKYTNIFQGWKCHHGTAKIKSPEYTRAHISRRHKTFRSGFVQLRATFALREQKG